MKKLLYPLVFALSAFLFVYNCSKNSDGYINSLTINGTEYSFTLDQNNLVTEIN